MDNRNDQMNQPGNEQAQRNNTTQTDRDQNVADENPQEGAQWDNYQTRTLSSDGSDKIEESDLLRADETGTQNTGGEK